MTNGWIKLHRSLDNWEWSNKPEMVALFVRLVLLANHEDSKWQGIEVKRGQLVTGLLSLHQKTGISIQTLRTCLDRLESTGELTRKTTNKFSIITICNYESYQCDEREINNQTNKQLTINQQTTNNKQEEQEYKKKKNKERHGEFVFLEIEEFEKLKTKFGEKATLELIDTLNNYIGSKSVKYKSHYHTLLNFAKRDNTPEIHMAPLTIDLTKEALEIKRKEKREPAFSFQSK